MEVVTATGKVIWTFPLGGSISPRDTDEGLSQWFLNIEALSPNQGSFEALLRGLPGYRVVHLFDKGNTFVYQLNCSNNDLFTNSQQYSYG